MYYYIALHQIYFTFQLGIFVSPGGSTSGKSLEGDYQQFQSLIKLHSNGKGLMNSVQ